MDINRFVEDIVNAEQKLRELKVFEEHRANGDITEAVLICHPKIKNILETVIHENNLKVIPIFSTPLLEEDKVYMVTDKEVIKRARMMEFGGGLENIETVRCKHWECPYVSCICHESHELFKDDYNATFNNPEYCMEYLDV